MADLPIQVLLVEDNPGDTRLVCEQVGEVPDLSVHPVERLATCIEHLGQHRVDIVLLDLGLPDSQGLATLRTLVAAGCVAPIVVLTGQDDEETGQAALRDGAQDYLIKGQVTTQALVRSVRYAIERQESRAKLQHLNLTLRALRNVDQLILHERDPSRLVQQACEVLVQTRGYRGAWVVLAGELPTPFVFGHSGWQDDFEPFSRKLQSGWPLPCRDRLATSESGLSVVDPKQSCGDCPLASHYGDDLAACARLSHGARTFGVLGVAIPRALANDQEETSLLREVADDVAFALHDIATERARREGEELFRVTFDEAAVGQALISLDGRFQRVNSSFSGMLGREAQELEGHSVDGFAHVDDRDRGDFNRANLLHGKLTARFEQRFVTPEERIVWTDVNLALLRRPDGKPDHYVATFVDISSRKVAERQQELVVKVLERLNSPENAAAAVRDIALLVREHTGMEAVGVRLRDGKDFPYVEANGFSARFVEAERLLCARDAAGGVVHDAAGQPVLECMCGNVLCGRTDPQQRFFTAGGSFWTNSTTDLLNSTKEADLQGHTRNRCNREGYESVALVPLRSGAETIGLLQLNDRRRNALSADLVKFLEGLGASVGVALTRQHAAETLEFQKMLLESQNQASLDGILLIDVQGRILWFNRRFVEQWGVSAAVLETLADEAVMETVLVQLKDPAGFMGQIRELRTQRTTKTRDELRLQDGRVFDRYSSPLTGDSGEHLGRLWLFRDVSDVKGLQASLAQADRLSTMGMLAAGVAHEINNPLSYVLYNIQSLSEDLPKLTGAMGRCYGKLCAEIGSGAMNELLGLEPGAFSLAQLEDILERLREALSGTNRIKDIARGLGTFSRVERTEVSPVNVQHSIEHALSMAFNEIKYRARLVKDFGAVSPVLASDGKLAQVFLNLLMNAAHAIGEGNVDQNEIRVRTWTAAGQVFAEVSDTGKGIPIEHASRIFEPFFTTKGVGVGSGLGLAICRNIVSNFGGDITFTSEPGAGTRFLVRLPVIGSEWESQPSTTEVAGAAPIVHGRVLVVDDEAGIRLAIQRLLRRDHEVVAAACGAEGKAILERDQAFDLLFFDLMMPQLSGMDLHEWLAATHPQLASQVVFVTGGAFTPNASSYLARVQNLTIEKPFDMTSFRKIAEELVFASKARQSR